jgi:hypothetical protein
MSDSLKSVGVTCAKDLTDLYGSANLIDDVGKCLSRIEMDLFKKAAAKTRCLAGISFPALGEAELKSGSEVTEKRLLAEEQALNALLKKSRMDSRSASGATAVRIDVLKKEVELLEKKERDEALKSAKCEAIEVALETKVKKTHARKESILGNFLVCYLFYYD